MAKNSRSKVRTHRIRQAKLKARIKRKAEAKKAAK
jgi:hypothetical protein